ncbi:MAG TPA: Ig-like domain-containing protein [Longimicrobiaceae bacterium]|jgi:hypothetical protein
MQTMRTARRQMALALCLCAGLLAAAGCDEPTRSEAVAAVELAVPTTRLAVGQSIQLSAAVRGAAGQVLSGRGVAWSSSNEAVATVDGGGRVTGRAPGPVTITAAAGGKQERVELVVEAAATAPGPVARVSMEPDSFLLVVGNTVAIRVPTEDHAANARARILAVPRDAAGAVLLWLPVRFTTSDAAVATVSDSGVVRAVAPGTAVITAQVGTAEGRLAVTVERPWTTTYLGTLPGTPESVATAISPLGQVVGRSGGRGWSWQDGRMTELAIPDSLGTGASVFPGAVNARGQVGGTVIAPSGQYIAQWEGGRVTLVPSSTTWPNTRFGGMNERGEMVGSWVADRCTNNCLGVGWIYRAGQVSQVGTTNTLSQLTLAAINDRGQIAASREFRSVGGALLFENAAAEPTPLPTNPGSSNAADIDEQGRVYGQDYVNFEVRGFVWSPATGVRHFKPLPGGAISGPTRANNLGLAVGRSACAGCPALLPVIFRDGRAIRIEDLLAGGDWIWETAADVNDRGQVVGWGTHRATGVRGALLLTPPAP